jgi:hypothetical protein
MIVLGDIAELWRYRKPGKFVCMKDGSTEVAVIHNCTHLCRCKNQEGLLPKSYDIPLDWNVEDYKFFNRNLPNEMRLFHFTSLPHQPWFYKHPNKEAIALYEKYKT